MNTFEYIVSEADGGSTVYRILRNRMGVSEAIVRHARKIDDGIFLDGMRCRTDAIASAGQVISLSLLDNGRSTSIQPEPGPLNVVFEDDALIVVDKPAGLVVHPSRGHFEGTLCNFMAHYLMEKGECATPHPVNRLDRETSGLIVFAKHAHAQNLLQPQLHTNRFERTYLALCEGSPSSQSGTVDAPIARLRDEYGSFGIREDGKRAVTHYRVLSSLPHPALPGETLSCVQLSLETGRTHQIRVHMSSIGLPLLGDTAYGSPSPLINRCALHSHRVSLIHPATGQRVELVSPLPDDMASIIPPI